MERGEWEREWVREREDYRRQCVGWFNPPTSKNPPSRIPNWERTPPSGLITLTDKADHESRDGQFSTTDNAGLQWPRDNCDPLLTYIMLPRFRPVENSLFPQWLDIIFAENEKKFPPFFQGLMFLNFQFKVLCCDFISHFGFFVVLRIGYVI